MKDMLTISTRCPRSEEEVFPIVFPGEHHTKHEWNAPDVGIDQSNVRGKDIQYHVQRRLSLRGKALHLQYIVAIY